MTGTSNYTVRVVKDLSELKALAVSWNEVLGQTSADSIFLTWEWLYTWAKHYLEDNKLWTVLVYDDNGRLVGIAPLYIARTKTWGGVVLRDLRFLGTKGVASSYLDFIVPERHKKAFLGVLYLHLHGSSRPDWDFLTLSELPAGSSTIDLLDALIQGAGEVMEIAEMTSCPVIQLPDGVPAFGASLSRNERYNVRRKQQRLDHAGHVDFVRASLVRDVDTQMETFMRLHQMRWRQKGAKGVFGSPASRAFHQEISRVLGERGRVSLDFLLLNGEPIAGIYGFIYGQRYYFYLPGFDADAIPKASPGILLLYHRIEEAIREGCTEVDLLRGVDAYKMAWATGIRRSLTLRHYSSHIRAAWAQLMGSGKSIVKMLLR